MSLTARRLNNISPNVMHSNNTTATIFVIINRRVRLWRREIRFLLCCLRSEDTLLPLTLKIWGRPIVSGGVTLRS